MQDWERFGEEIRRTVQDAVDSQDYRKLNQTITDTINRAVNGAVNDIGTGIRLMSICSCSHNASSESIANSSSEIVSRLTPGK